MLMTSSVIAREFVCRRGGGCSNSLKCILSGLITGTRFLYQRRYSMKTHAKCRNSSYPGTNGKIERFKVPDDKVSWLEEWKEYNPPNYTSESVLGKPWADPEIEEGGFQHKVEWNSPSEAVNRERPSHKYEVKDGYPINPVGRTGLKGRGLLGRWGPNCAADPIVTRWKRNEENHHRIDEGSGRRVLQFVAIQRRDCGEWAIPGGFVDQGEKVGTTLRREFMEEALNSFEGREDEKESVMAKLEKLFSEGELIYSGYVDDPRNTDNAWITTTAVLFHDECGNILNNIHLSAGDDAGKVVWKDVSDKLELYASHRRFIHDVAVALDAHWQ